MRGQYGTELRGRARAVVVVVLPPLPRRVVLVVLGRGVLGLRAVVSALVLQLGLELALALRLVALWCAGACCARLRAWRGAVYRPSGVQASSFDTG